MKIDISNVLKWSVNKCIYLNTLVYQTADSKYLTDISMPKTTHNIVGSVLLYKVF